jgi:hypothetical protein
MGRLFVVAAAVAVMAFTATMCAAAADDAAVDASASWPKCGDVCNPDNSTCPDSCACIYVSWGPLVYRCNGGRVPPPPPATPVPPPPPQLQCGATCRQGDGTCPDSCPCRFVSWGPLVYRCSEEASNATSAIRKQRPARH